MIEIYQSDCMQFMQKMKDCSVDAIITDPPYNVVNRSGGNLRKIGYLNKGEADSAAVDIPSIASELVRIASGSIYVWCSSEQVSEWRRCFVKEGLTTRQCVWVKSNPAPINGEKMWLSGVELCIFARKPKAPFFEFCKNPVWTGPTERIGWHPTPKPVWLMRALVKASVPPGGTVLDPFCGSGSTGVACAREGRNFIGVDMNQEYVTKALERIHNDSPLLLHT